MSFFGPGMGLVIDICQSLKIQNFQPVMKSVDVEKIKEEFKAKAGKKA